jgi:hypothetical protein
MVTPKRGLGWTLVVGLAAGNTKIREQLNADGMADQGLEQ